MVGPRCGDLRGIFGRSFETQHTGSSQVLVRRSGIEVNAQQHCPVKGV
jgi:hypothetical protein